MNAERIARKELVDRARSVFERGLTPGRTGNLSQRIPGGRFLMTPSGISLGALDGDQLSVIDEDGTLIDGAPPTKELGLHLALYRSGRGDAVVHLHSPWAMAYSCRDDLAVQHPIPFLTPYLPMRVPDLRLVSYHPPGSAELAAAVTEASGFSGSLLLRRHGTMVARPTLAEALDAAEEIEQGAMVALNAGSSAMPLSEAEITALIATVP